MYVRFGARRFAITLVPSAERRFGVEREPVVTYARARACVSTRQRALPSNVGAAASVRARTADHRQHEREDRGSYDSVRRFFQRTSAPALPLRERRSDRNTTTLCRSLLRGGGGPRVLGRAARLIEGPRFFLSLSLSL